MLLRTFEVGTQQNLVGFLINYKKCLNVRQNLGTRSLSHTLSFSHSLTLSISHSLILNMLNNFCFHVYAQKSLSLFHSPDVMAATFGDKVINWNHVLLKTQAGWKLVSGCTDGLVEVSQQDQEYWGKSGVYKRQFRCNKCLDVQFWRNNKCLSKVKCFTPYPPYQM